MQARESAVDRLQRAVKEADAASIAMEAASDCRNDHQAKYEGGATPGEKRDLRSHSEHLLPSEAEVLERLRRLAVENRRAALVPSPGGEIALGDPRSGAVRRR